MNLEEQLRQEFLKAVKICIDRYGYHPTRFLQMLGSKGPIQTSISLVTDPTYSEGFTKMLLFNRLDLTVEAIITREPYNHLFRAEILDRATSKLNDAGYIKPEQIGDLS